EERETFVAVEHGKSLSSIERRDFILFCYRAARAFQIGATLPEPRRPLSQARYLRYGRLGANPLSQ
ncbi:MAG: hypothetical protein AAF865_12940, partial [Pseudomonadota bacterium]